MVKTTVEDFYFDILQQVKHVGIFFPELCGLRVLEFI